MPDPFTDPALPPMEPGDVAREAITMYQAMLDDDNRCPESHARESVILEIEEAAAARVGPRPETPDPFTDEDRAELEKMAKLMDTVARGVPGARGESPLTRALAHIDHLEAREGRPEYRVKGRNQQTFHSRSGAEAFRRAIRKPSRRIEWRTVTDWRPVDE